MSELDRVDIREEVRSKTDIVALVSEYVQLKRSGGNFLGLCPFHNEKTPSFNVNNEKKIFHCFGCGVGGDAFDFLMRIEGITFPEALERLAERIGIEVASSKSEADDEMAKRRAAFYEVYKLTAKYYYITLLKNDIAYDCRHYLIDRGITAEDVTNFRLGFASASGSAVSEFLTSKGYAREFLIESGLVSPSKMGDRLYDRMRNRVMFPIFDDRRRIVGFGGRVLDDSQPKYLNSPETPIFDKRRCLYGICQARDTIRAESKAVLVEGYMDVIACHRAGLKNAVASLGTSFTKEQAKLLSRYAKDIVICYDSDSAGRTATLKAYEALVSGGFRVKAANLGAAKDPDEMFKQLGAQALYDVIDKADSVVLHQLDYVLKQVNINTPEGKIEAVSRMVPILAISPNAVERSEYGKVVAQALGVAYSAVEEELAKLQHKSAFASTGGDTPPAGRNTNRKTVAKTVPQGINRSGLPGALVKAERGLLSLLLDDREKIDVFKNSMGTDAFKVPLHRTVAGVLFSDACLKDDGIIDLDGLLHGLEDESARNFITRLALEHRQDIDKERLFLDYVNKIREYQLRDEIDRLIEQAKEFENTGRFDERNECLRRYKTCRERLQREFCSPRS